MCPAAESHVHEMATLREQLAYLNSEHKQAKLR